MGRPVYADSLIVAVELPIFQQFGIDPRLASVPVRADDFLPAGVGD